MERLPNSDALELLEVMRGKMLMLYVPVDSASDELMHQGQALGSFAIGFSLRQQYRELWKDWERLAGIVGLEDYHGTVGAIPGTTTTSTS